MHKTKTVFCVHDGNVMNMMGWIKMEIFLPGVFGPCQMPPSEQRGCPALLLWMNANEGVCVCLNVIHTSSNWACKEVQNWGWQPPKPKQPGRRYMCLGHSACMDYYRGEKNNFYLYIYKYKHTHTLNELLEKKVSAGKLLMFVAICCCYF